jgi:hypothetical protein
MNPKKNSDDDYTEDTEPNKIALSKSPARNARRLSGLSRKLSPRDPVLKPLLSHNLDALKGKCHPCSTVGIEQ